MYRVLLADDEVLIREAISENMDWKARVFPCVQSVKMDVRQ